MRIHWKFRSGIKENSHGTVQNFQSERWAVWGNENDEGPIWLIGKFENKPL